MCSEADSPRTNSPNSLSTLGERLQLPIQLVETLPPPSHALSELARWFRDETRRLSTLWLLLPLVDYTSQQALDELSRLQWDRAPSHWSKRSVCKIFTQRSYGLTVKWLKNLPMSNFADCSFGLLFRFRLNNLQSLKSDCGLGQAWLANWSRWVNASCSPLTQPSPTACPACKPCHAWPWTTGTQYGCATATGRLHLQRTPVMQVWMAYRRRSTLRPVQALALPTCGIPQSGVPPKLSSFVPGPLSCAIRRLRIHYQDGQHLSYAIRAFGDQHADEETVQAIDALLLPLDNFLKYRLNLMRRDIKRSSSSPCGNSRTSCCSIDPA